MDVRQSSSSEGIGAMYSAETIADSVSPEGFRISTVKVVYPHAVHKDMLRHRAHSRSVESFRARPPEDILRDLRANAAFKPDVFASRIRGMGQSSEVITEAEKASLMWDSHVEHCCRLAEAYLAMGLAKQQVNFILQDISPLTEIITATDWTNFLALRTELREDGTPVARPEVYRTAKIIEKTLRKSSPTPLTRDMWHLPFVSNEELATLNVGGLRRPSESWVISAEERRLVLLSAGRCARISFGDYAWQDEDPEVSIQRAKRLVGAGHMSPYEHQAQPFSMSRWKLVHQIQALCGVIGTMPRVIPDPPDVSLFSRERTEIRRMVEYSANFHGWVAARKMMSDEEDYSVLKRKRQLKEHNPQSQR